MAFSPEQLLSVLDQYPKPRCYWVAFSGGLDSTVLLEALTSVRGQLSAPLQALHVNHGLQEDASYWAAHCRRQCENLSVPLTEIELALEVAPGQSLEAEARDARYQALSQYVNAGDILLTAHHGDDQVETFLLQWLRGSGIHGLAAMPEIKSWKQGWLARPLLTYSRSDLQNYAQLTGLTWVDDTSNQELRFDRNYLRNEVIPLLKTRWPGLMTTSARSARHCASAAGLADEIAASDLNTCRGVNRYRLSLLVLDPLSRPRKENLLRHWIARQGLQTPNTHKIRRILSEVVLARADADPIVSWAGIQVRRFGSELYLLPRLPDAVGNWNANWDGREDLPLPDGLGQLQLVGVSPDFEAGLMKQGRVSVGFRREGLQCTPSGRQGNRSFKRLTQDLSIPPWLRSRVPLMFVDQELAAVGDFCICQPFDQKDFELRWNRDDFL